MAKTKIKRFRVSLSMTITTRGDKDVARALFTNIVLLDNSYPLNRLKVVRLKK